MQRHRQPPLRLATQRRPIHCRAAAKSTQSEAGERLAEWLAQWKHDDCGVAVKPEDDGNGRVSLRRHIFADALRETAACCYQQGRHRR